MKQNKYEIDMCNGTIMDKLISFSLPLMLSGILQLMFNAVDIIVVGRFSGSQALAAVGSTTALINVFTNLFIGISLGANVLAARYYATGKTKEMSETVHTAIALALVSGVAMAVIGVVFARGALEIMGTPDDVIAKSTLYMRIYFCGMPFFMMYNYGAMPVVYCGHTAAVGSMSTCDKTRYSAAKIERIVLVALRKQLEIFQSMAKILEEGEEKNKTNLPAMQRNMEQELEKLKAERIRQYEAYAEGVVNQETYLKNKKDLNEKIEIIQDKYEQIQEVRLVKKEYKKLLY